MIKQILPDLYRITLPMPFRLRHVNIHILTHNGKVALFDTGLNIPESFQALEEALSTLGRTVADIDQVFLTHFHPDHCGIAGAIQKRSGAAVRLSATDERRLQNNSRREDFIAKARDFYLPQGLPQKVLERLIKLSAVFQNVTLPFRADSHLEPNGKYTVGQRVFEAVPAAGHTAGQMCFFFPEEGVLLAGDHLLPDITPNLSPDPFQPGYRPLRHFLNSLESIRDLSVKMVSPAHGEPFTDLNKRVDEIRDHHGERTQLVVRALQGGSRTAFEVSREIFGKDLPDFDQVLALNETYVHLVHLADNGRVKSEEQNGFVLYRTG